MKKAIIFDLDGTLLNTLGDLRNAANESLRLRGLPLRSLDEVQSFIGNGVRNLIRRCLPEGASELEIDDALADFKQYYGSHLCDSTVPYDGIPELLCALREHGLKIGVLSNKLDSATQKLIQYYFPNQVDAIFGEHDDIPRKPDPTSCRIMMKQLQVQPEDVLYVGDSGVDMQTANNAGLTAIGVTWGFRSRKELLENGAHMLADSPEQILTMIEENEKVYLAKSAMEALREAQNAFTEEAERTGLKNQDDVVAMVNEFRRKHIDSL